MTGLEVLGRELSLPNEHRLGGGGRAMWIPPNPTAIDLPGFRDAGRFGNRSLDTVFAVSLLDEHGRFIETKATERNWNPARLELRYRLPEILLIERRTVMSCDAFVSHWTLTHSAEVPKRFWLVVWTRLAAADGMRFGELDANGRGISIQQTPARRGMSFDQRFGFALGASMESDSWSIASGTPTTDFGTSTSMAGDWPTTPFFERMTPRGLPGCHPERIEETEGLQFALAYPIEVRPGERAVASFVAAVAEDAESARGNMESVAGMVHPIQSSEEEWINWFEEAPAFECSNPVYQRLYWSRWADRRLWRSWQPDDSPFASTAFGPEAGAAIENSWRLNNDEAVECIAQWLDRPLARTLDQPIGLVARKLLSLHPDADLLADLERLAEQLAEDESPLFDDTSAIERDLSTNLRAVFAADLLRLGEWIANKEDENCPAIGTAATRLLAKVAAHANSDCASYSPLSLLPALVGALDDDRLVALTENLFDPDHFWTAHPLASRSRKAPDFQAESVADDVLNVQGRVWPSINALTIDALGTGIDRASPLRRLALAQLVDRTLRLGFRDGDLHRPEFHEHYNPLNGRPGGQSGRQRPAGGWPIDHVLRYIVGIRPREDGKLVIDPLPFGLEWFTVDRLYIGDREFRVEWDQKTGLSVRVDEEPAAHAPVGRPLAMHLPEHWPTDEAFQTASLWS